MLLKRSGVRYREFFFAMGFLFFLVAIAYSGYCRLAPLGVPRPILVCDTPLVRLGKISADQQVICDFLIRNSGQRPLILSDVKTGCGKCLEVIDFNRKPILPGESSLVRVRLLGGRVGSTQVNGVTVCSNDPVTPQYALRVSSDR